MSDYPHLFDDIGTLDRTTQLYTQRRKSTELPENYKFTIEELATFLQEEFHMVTADKLYYLHTQSSPSDIWNIHHGLGRPVQVRCKNASDENIVGEVNDDTMDDTSIAFTIAVDGTALCT